MKIAVLGGGFTGLTAAYHLQKKGHQVTIFEKETVLGGLAVGFKADGWEWFIERAVHHLLSSEDDILGLANETGFKKIIFREPETASFYEIVPDNYRIFPVDTPQDFLRLPVLSWPAKFRAGATLAFLKLSPFLSIYEKQTAREFLTKTMGEEGWNILWQQLFRKKFGKYAENILASFIWARIKKRSKKLGYIEGGFQTYINHLENKNLSLGTVVKKGAAIKQIVKGSKFTIRSSSSIETFDVVISTLPTPVIVKISMEILPDNYRKQLSRIQFLHAVSLLLETDKPVLGKTYWLNVVVKNIPIMGVFQHTNFMDKKHYGNRHLCYVGWYVDNDSPLLKMDKEEIIKFVEPHLQKISSRPLRDQISNSFLFKAPWAQPIFDKAFLKSKPDFMTPVKNFYIANLDMTYPYDRGTNYAVKLGKEVAELI